MFNRSRMLIAAAISAAAARVMNNPPRPNDAGVTPPRPLIDAENNQRVATTAMATRRDNWLEYFRNLSINLRKWWRRGGGDQEIERRRRQIERGQLTASNGLVRVPHEDVQ